MLQLAVILLGQASALGGKKIVVTPQTLLFLWQSTEDLKKTNSSCYPRAVIAKAHQRIVHQGCMISLAFGELIKCYMLFLIRIHYTTFLHSSSTLSWSGSQWTCILSSEHWLWGGNTHTHTHFSIVSSLTAVFGRWEKTRELRGNSHGQTENMRKVIKTVTRARIILGTLELCECNSATHTTSHDTTIILHIIIKTVFIKYFQQDSGLGSEYRTCQDFVVIVCTVSYFSCYSCWKSYNSNGFISFS